MCLWPIFDANFWRDFGRFGGAKKKLRISWERSELFERLFTIRQKLGEIGE
jgi:hypothetical protein